MLSLEVKPYILDFNFSARTSRGIMRDRKVWFLKVTGESGISGLGEVAPINRLSPESPEDILEELTELKKTMGKLEMPGSEEEVFTLVQECVRECFPSIRCGLEVALLDLLNGGERHIFCKNFQDISIPINGLIWMGSRDLMKQQIIEKIDQGFSCIKLKVGALDFETEVAIIRELRCISDELIIRLDANGAFQTNEVLSKLKTLAQFNIHSIEQPILPMQPEAMEIVCAKSQIPIALDEELIGIYSPFSKMDFLQNIKPQYLVLKPTLHGGFSSIREWIELAEMHGIKWWITSYLESNIGLNAIIQFTTLYNNEEYHGLGTGNLYSNNIISPIIIDKGWLTYTRSNVWGDTSFMDCSNL